MTRAEAQRRYNETLDTQRRFLNDDVPQRLKSEPSWDFRLDSDYQKRNREMADLQLQIRSGRFDSGGSGAGREDTRGGNEFGQPSQPSYDAGGYRGYSPEQRAQLEALGTLMIGGENAVERSHGGVLQRASLSTASGAVGGFLVPEFVAVSVVEDLTKFQSVRRHGARVLPLRGNENLPLIHDPESGWISEADAVSTGLDDKDPTFSQIEIRPTLQFASTRFSWHLQNFSPANVEEEIRKSFSRALAKGAAQKFLTGSGTNEPEGLKHCGTGVTTASTTAFTAAEVLQQWNSLEPWYQADAVWIVSPAWATLLRTLETDNGTPLWRRELATGNEMLLGRPLVVDPFMEPLEADKVPAIVGSMSEAYTIAESQLFLVVDPYTRHKFAQNVVTMYVFTDGRIRRSDAAKAMVMNDGL